MRPIMLEDLYLMAVLARHRVEEGAEATPNRVRTRLMPLQRRWGRQYLEGVTVAGSYAKGTAIRRVTLAPKDVDVDLFLSLRADAPGSLADYQAALARNFLEYQPTMGNVSVKILVENTRVDLTAGRQTGESGGHTLWQARRSGWLRTNVAEQIRCVRESGCLEAIRLLKVWRRRQGLYFPSFCLELSVIEALKEEEDGSLGGKFVRVLSWLADELPGAALRDPANRSNVVSDVMTQDEKWKAANAAWMSVRAGSWTEVV